MSYPQPDPNKYAIGGQKFWRLNTTLISDGDIYESEQGASGFAIGPDSDISKVNIAYFDDQVPGFMNQVAISPQRPFPGTIYARNDAGYTPSNRPGRFLLWPDELYNIDWRPGDFDPGNYRLDFITPVLDVVQYFNGDAGQTLYRNDKNYQFQMPGDMLGEAGFWGLVVPFYGRRYASIFFANPDLTQQWSIGVWGLTYPQSATGLNQNVELKQILGTAVVASATNKEQVVRATVDGMFDALFIKFTLPEDATEPGLLRIRTSDREA